MAIPSPKVFLQGALTPVSADNLNGMIQTVANVASLRLFTGTNNQTIWMEGTAANNDGGQALYYYDSGSTAADNGTTVIAPTGSTTGRWILTTPYAAPGTFGFQEVTINTGTVVSSTSGNNFYVATAGLTLDLPLTTLLTNRFMIGVYAEGGLVTIVPNGADSINGMTAGQDYLLQENSSVFLTTDAAGNWWPFFFGPRAVLSNQLDLYVSPSGSDSNSGLSVGSPFLTLQHAWDVLIQGYDLRGHEVFIHCADGIYTSGVTCGGNVVGYVPTLTNGGNFPHIHWVGNTASPGSCLIQTGAGNCFTISGASVRVDGFKFIATDASSGEVGWAINLFAAGYVVVDNVEFGACQAGHVISQGFSSCFFNHDFTISGGATTAAHMWASYFGAIAGGTITITLTGTPSFPNFAVASMNSGIIAQGFTYSGGATGARYNVSLNSTIQTNGGGANFFPGNSPGTTSTGGIYN